MSRKSRRIRRTAPVTPNVSTPAAEQCEIRGTEIGSLNSSQLELDYSYQRPTEPERVRSIVAQFDPALVNLFIMVPAIQTTAMQKNVNMV